MIAHHPTTLRLAVEIAVVAVIAVVLTAVWLWGRRRRVSRPPAPMRDDRPDLSD